MTASAAYEKQRKPRFVPTHDVNDGRPTGNLRCLDCLTLFPIGQIHTCVAESEEGCPGD